jgi:DNA-binding beta-propeller fold protein YncE
LRRRSWSVYVIGSTEVRFNRNTTTGWIAQPAGTAGCISASGSDECAEAHGHGLDGPLAVTVSPAGKNVYVAALALARLNRSTTTGAISRPAGAAAQCISEPGTGAEPCADGHGLKGLYSVVVSPDGKSVYTTSYGSRAVARFHRAP